MEIPKLTLSGNIDIPMLGLGTWLLSGRACYDSVKTAIHLGYTHIDTAEIYNNQPDIGESIKNFDRKKLFITSKIWHANLNYEKVLNSCEKTLKELKTSYLDLYLIHWPNKNIHVSETLLAMKKLHDEGKIKTIGVSNFTIRHVKEAIEASKIPLTINQVEFHPLLYQKELLDYSIKNKIYITAYSPLARGQVYNISEIKKIASNHNKTPGQISLRWLIQKKIIVIPKASSEKHLKENMQIFDFALSEKEMQILDSIKPQKRLVNPSFGEFGYA